MAPDQNKELQALERKRAAYKGKLTKLAQRFQNHNDGSSLIREEEVPEIHSHIKQLEEKVRELHEQIFLVCTTDGETNDAVNESEIMEEKIREFYIQIKSMQKSSRSSSSSSVIGSSNSSVKLPRIELPVFDGSFENWTSFQDLFIATVDSNSSLSGAQKLQYLKACVKNEALQLIKSFTITDPHYYEAWALLTNRYDNVREITFALIRKMFHVPALKHESATGLQKLLDVTTECLRSLAVIGRSTEYWDDLIVFNLMEKLDPETRREWAISMKTTDPPTLKSIQEFIQQHICGLIAGGQKPTNPVKTEKKQTSSFATVAHSTDCLMCKQSHPLFQCAKFLALTPEQRSEKIRNSSYCANCLRRGHFAKRCQMKTSCRICSKRHNSLLHLNHQQPQNPQSGASAESSSDLHSMHSVGTENSQVLLKTVLVKAADSVGNQHIIRAFLDDGSEASFISESCVTALGLKKTQANIQISGLSSVSVGQCKAKVNVRLSSCTEQFYVNVPALVVNKVSALMPRRTVTVSQWSHIKGLKLADPSFHCPQKIDMLLGADVVAACVQPGIHRGPKNTPTAFNTSFGWVLSGRIANEQVHHILTYHTMESTNDVLKKFWEVEQIPDQRFLTPIESECETHFKQTHARDANGRYTVKLPFNNQKEFIGSSREQASRRLHSLEKKLSNQPKVRDQYNQFMDEYEKLGHMQLVKSNEIQQSNFYLPHHFVIREESSSTKLRVVFDGSAKSSSGISLNQSLKVGPTIQDELLQLLLRFRTFPIALKADIRKMYRQFQVDEADTHYQRILWRPNPDQPVRDYRLTTVTYGTSCAPYLATKCIAQLAEDEASNYPKASTVLKNDMYVDDLLTGGNSSEEVIRLQKQLSELVQAGGLEFAKWMSSDAKVLKSIPPNQQENQTPLDLNREAKVSTLGVQWVPSSDVFTYCVPVYKKSLLTKRLLLSELAKVFDPLGLLSPVTVTAKIMLQDLWKTGVSWDTELNEDWQVKWHQYQTELTAIHLLQIPRFVTQLNSEIEIHGFSDASEKAYCAAVYIRSESSSGDIKVRLVAAKTKVAPIKLLSLPRLELCGAYLLANLVNYVKCALKINSKVTGWTDSSVVLRWLQSYPARWKTFVANRVAAIQENIPSESWRHISGEENPSDLGTRGIPAASLPSSSKWWIGPKWLSHKTIPSFISDPNLEEVNSERKQISLMVNHHACTPCELTTQFSTLKKTIHVAAYVFRFLSNCKPGSTKLQGPITVQEYQTALSKLIKIVQVQNFPKEIAALGAGNEVCISSSLKFLYPFLDETGLLRVGGRIQNSKTSVNARHQIILPSKNHLVQLLIRECHIRTLHGGFQLVLSTIRQRYWIIRARDSIRRITRSCVTCRKVKSNSMKQLMGNLPSPRVNISHPFLQTGVDYAGPFEIIKTRGRGAKTIKCYFAIFMCLATKAVHLECVMDLTTEAFLGCLNRFVSRRGLPNSMHSDNATNFTKAAKVLAKEFQLLVQSNQCQSFLNEHLIQWKFIPPSAPHHGGLWESGVRCVKYHLKRVLGAVHPTLEEFRTLLTRIEGILNSRPLCAMSPDPEDLDVLTPGHFLIGRPMNAIPVTDVIPSSSLLSRWKTVQLLTQNFWKRWRLEYRSSLQQRHKWTKKGANAAIGDLVVIHENNSPMSMWRMGRVIETHPGDDNIVRVVTVKTANGVLKRPITKLTPILFNNENS